MLFAKEEEILDVEPPLVIVEAAPEGCARLADRLAQGHPEEFEGWLGPEPEPLALNEASQCVRLAWMRSDWDCGARPGISDSRIAETLGQTVFG